MSTSGYRKGLGKHEEIEEDELLASLTSEELQELEKIMAEMEPDENIPIGLQQEDQTAKKPTGTFCRGSLLKYWEDETQRLLKDSMDECQTDKCEEECASEEPEDNKEKGGDRVKQARSNKWNSVELSRLDSESARKYNDAPHYPVTLDGSSCNPTDIDKTLEHVLSNATSLSEVNLNNVENLSQGVLVGFADALTSNTHVEVFNLANTHADDQVALALAKMLKANSSITRLNVESNFISGKGILALIKSLQYNNTLTELRFHNQRHICGGQVEMEMVKLLKDNTSLLKLGYHFELPGPRMSATGILTRNQDRHRQKRLQERREKDKSQEQVKSWNTVDKMQSFQFQISTDKHTTQGKQHLVSSYLPQPPHNQPNGVINVPMRQIAETVKQQEETENVGRIQANSNKKHNLTGDKHGKKKLHDDNTEHSRRKDDLNSLEESTRDDLLAAIRGSNIGSLRRVKS